MTRAQGLVHHLPMLYGIIAVLLIAIAGVFAISGRKKSDAPFEPSRFWSELEATFQVRYDGDRWRDHTAAIDEILAHADALGIGDAGRRLLVDARDRVLDMLTAAATVSEVNTALGEVKRLIETRGAWPPEAPTAVAGEGEPWRVATLRLDAPLSEQLREHVDRARALSLAPVFEITASWGPPSLKFGQALETGLLQAAMAGIYLIRGDIEFSNTQDDAAAWFDWRVFPVFFPLGADARPMGEPLTGDAWAENTPECIAPAFRDFAARITA